MLAHAIPEGIANLSMALIAIVCMFFADWKLALLSLCSLPLSLFAMGMMFKAGILDVSGKYKGRIYGAMVLSFFKGMLMKVPAIAVFLIVFMFLFDWRLGLASFFVTGCMILLGWGKVKSDLSHYTDRQDASEIQTQAELDFTEGIGSIKTYNLLGEKTKELTSSFEHNCKVNLDFEAEHAPWARGVNMIYAAGTVLVLAVSTFLFFKGAMPLNYYIGMLLFLFDLFVPIKTFYDQEARLTVMSACMDRIEVLFAEKQLDDSGTQTLTDSNAPEIEYRNVTFAYTQKDVILDEATASVDAENESYIQQAISELCKGKTLLVIAHRLNTIVGADNIVVIRDGQVAA